MIRRGFLDVSSHLYMRPCPSVGLSVGPSVGETFEFPKSIFAKCTRLACLLSFANLFLTILTIYQLICLTILTVEEEVQKDFMDEEVG